jgi:RNA polymerase sigma factor (sigma-70 family)
MSHPPADSPDAMLARLARDNPQHLRWLHQKAGASFSDEDLADILQAAHVDATVALHSSTPPAFPDWARTVAWFRRICSNTAIDEQRHRDGRRASERAARPEYVSLDALVEASQQTDALLGAADESLESVAIDEVDDEVRRAVAEALRRLPDADRRILCWRYHDNLEPDAITRLEGITHKQYERRHLSAVKALGRELARLELNIGCAQARRLLRRRPHALLEPAAGAARVHVEDCPACRAFRLQIRGALAAIPLPASAIGAKLLFAQTAPATTPTTSAAPAAPHGDVVHAALANVKAVAAIAATTLAIGGGGLAVTGRNAPPAPPAPNVAQHGTSVPETTHLTIVGESLAEHLAHDPLMAD